MGENASGAPEDIEAPGPSVRSLVQLVPRTLQDDPIELAVELREEHGHVVRIPPVYPGLENPAYLVTHPEDVRYVLQSHPTEFRGLDVPGAMDFGRVVENSIVSLTEDSEEGSWMARLRQLSPEFNERALAHHVPELATETLSTLAEYESTRLAAEAASPDPGRVQQLFGAERDPARVWANTSGGVRLLPAMRRLSLRMLGVTLFGPDVRVHEAEVIRAVARLRDQFKSRHLSVVTGTVTQHLPERITLPSFVSDPLGHEVAIPVADRGENSIRDTVGTLRRVADEIVERRERTPRLYDDALSTWMTRPDPVTGEPLDPETARQEIVGLLIAGFATTSAALTWAVYLSAAHPWVQERIHDEVRETELFDSLSDVRSDGSIEDGIDGAAAFEQLSFTRRVWRETLRLYPVLPMFGRTTREAVTLGGYDVEAGAPVLVSPYVTHRDPEFWDDPEAFDPDRFRPERSRDRPEFAYYPFSGGPHACLGEMVATTEAVVALAAMFGTYRVEFVNESTHDAGDGSIDGVPGPGEISVAEWTGEHAVTEGAYDALDRDAPDVGVDSGINLQPDREIVVRFVPR